ncbi:MAG: site-specific integrase [Anaerolineae bacterium]|nr:site-specific integrase [Anaerolineae bacterium]
MRAIWRYMATRPDYTLVQPLFASDDGDTIPLNRNALYRLLSRLGKRAGVNNCHPHRFRHTFAIEFLRNGGDIYSLQRMMGHSTLEMVKTYLSIVQSDIENTHRRASPVDNWKL